MVNRPVLEVRWDWLGEVDRKLAQKTLREELDEWALEEARDLFQVGQWYRIEGGSDFCVRETSATTCWIARKDQPALAQTWSQMARRLITGVWFLNPDGTIME